MDAQGRKHGYAGTESEDQGMGIRKGPWTIEEDSLLAHYITIHGEGHWNSAARCAGAESESPMDQPTISPPTYYSSRIDIPVAASESGSDLIDPNFMPDISVSSTLSDSFDAQVSPWSDLTDYQNPPCGQYYSDGMQNRSGLCPENDSGSWGWCQDGVDMQGMEQERYGFIGGGDSLDQSLWNEENIWFLQQQLM
ncbi:hypothetical protein H0E87_005225 [Populus deltoides]|uniref:Uncharacterized protein n=1 Tax=Populus deltoides TaxID=3696 RepID=A0A8T2ZK35_POPDE|nr:hypothetical protein H0E87_005225 [Populus deltoides]